MWVLCLQNHPSFTRSLRSARVPGSWRLEASNAGRGGGGGLGALGTRRGREPESLGHWLLSKVRMFEERARVRGHLAVGGQGGKGSTARILNRKVRRKT